MGRDADVRSFCVSIENPRKVDFILLVSLFLSVHIALAEADFDFSGYNYDQLIGIKEQLDAEIGTRPEAGERILQPGQYVVGKRMPVSI